MGLTQQQWYTKLRQWVPRWFFESEQYNDAVFQGFAKSLALIEDTIEVHVDRTFITQADGPYLDEHGAERNITRREMELDTKYAPRIQSLSNTTTIPAITELVNSLLDVGECTILEDYNANAFLNRDTYCNRGYLMFDAIYNVFSIIVDKQIHDPYSFLNRENFLNREDFVGTNESSLELFNTIVEAVNTAKAFGVLYRLVERRE